MILRYSATHKTEHNKVHRLDALDAYNQKLVKKIAVRGITVRKAWRAQTHISIWNRSRSPRRRRWRGSRSRSGKDGIKRQLKRLDMGQPVRRFRRTRPVQGLRRLRYRCEQRHSQVHQRRRAHAGEATGDVTERDIRRIQIREAIKAHLEKENALRTGHQGPHAVLIDEVAKYRDYSQGEKPASTPESSKRSTTAQG